MDLAERHQLDLSCLSPGQNPSTTITFERKRKPALHCDAGKVIVLKFSGEGSPTFKDSIPGMEFLLENQEASYSIAMEELDKTFQDIFKLAKPYLYKDTPGRSHPNNLPDARNSMKYRILKHKIACSHPEFFSKIEKERIAPPKEEIYFLGLKLEQLLTSSNSILQTNLISSSLLFVSFRRDIGSLARQVFACHFGLITSVEGADRYPVGSDPVQDSSEGGTIETDLEDAEEHSSGLTDELSRISNECHKESK
ncbi:unnamed protein product [Lepeophtheirus salmonis]|uniref:(salmon louse) hypothetical protein n=1 Tax=Lepeophtheirus salmonis TaxID=72036 RepID=A0A7R8GZC5_LEPSM|nr:unnamed protein product [Lepeophtheirus salmonis]CAF2750515.1 unnamed protein product [Lepeophtheirus salmonis]